jgi:epsilon-lactone hydrolase
MKRNCSSRFVLTFWLVVTTLAFSSRSQAVEPQVDDDGTVHVPAYRLPESPLLGADARSVLKNERRREKEQASAAKACPSQAGADAAHMPEIRQCQAELFYKSAGYRHLYELYRVVMTPKRIGGVYTEIFEPVGGIAAENARRVLINVHGGGFQGGARTESHMESVPIAAVGRIRIVSIDYRQAPEYRFPSASEDVAAVYRELLRTYKSGDIGIYGCSAGGLLTAEAVAWFQKKGLPLPGAVGMFCEGGLYWTEGDSGYTGEAFGWGSSSDPMDRNPYFKGVDPNDPLAFPARSAQVMARFPPSLLISGTRDVALSSVVYTHSLLVAQGVDASLHIWEGVGHGFFLDPDLPQSREVYSVIWNFFDTHLGTRARSLSGMRPGACAARSPAPRVRPEKSTRPLRSAPH